MVHRVSSGSVASSSRNRFSPVTNFERDSLGIASIRSLGVLQNYARKYTIPIDKLAFEFDILQEDNDIAVKPEDGAYIKGLFLEGARWSKTARVLNESLPKVLFDVLPIIWLRPGITEKFAVVNTYSCPVYKVWNEAEHQLWRDDVFRRVLDAVCSARQVIQRISSSWSNFHRIKRNGTGSIAVLQRSASLMIKPASLRWSSSSFFLFDFIFQSDLFHW